MNENANNHPKIVVIARCENEMENLPLWFENKTFCDHFVMTDNESTDGSTEYLKSRHDVTFAAVKGFDEGRDFQVLLRLARSVSADWVFKFDCDEFVGDDFGDQVKLIIKQSHFDCVMLRKVSKHFSLPVSRCFLTREYWNGGVYGVRLTDRINIRDQKIHVGSFHFYRRPVLLPALVTHFWVRSAADAEERAETYARADGGKRYKVKSEVDASRAVNYEDAVEGRFKSLRQYGVQFMERADENFRAQRPAFNRIFCRWMIKKWCWSILVFAKLSNIYLQLSNRS